jgi:uncharacterized protein
MLRLDIRSRKALVACALTLALLAGQALAGEIAVSAHGVAYGAPDRATLDVGFTTTEADVAEGLAQADAAIRAVRAALEAHGVDPLDVRTTVFSVWREERFEDRQGPTSIVYRVTHHLQVTVRDVDAVGRLLEAATSAGANHVGGVYYEVADAGELEAEARREAFAAARAKAEQIALLAGLTLGRAHFVAEGVVGGPTVSLERSFAMADGRGGAPVAAGQLGVEVWLEVRFETLP